MPDIILIFRRWGKRMAAITLAALTVAAITLLVLPKRYGSVATALPANSLATDKASVFNTSIQELYSSLGTADELDRFLGTAKLDTLYIALARDYNLHQHYKIKQNDHALYNAARKLKKESSIERSEYGELRVEVWDVDRNMAAQLANALMEKLQLLHQQLQSRSNALVLQKLQQAYMQLKGTDTAGVSNAALSTSIRQQQLAQYENLIAQYTLMVHTAPPALLIVESARPALTAGKPYVWPTLLLTLFVAFFFSFLLAVYLDSRRPQNV